ncbi:hypothetical protein T265_08143 [Opisthorchis viverrini]|uniref:Calmodulin-binding domain-containing protein n=1 Tax=Opisthorchis viverrini TaxID=6198 RepID=A0A075A9A9_OPIVI|nr:hypothetical protein T265_08143 [Opisthorchis viverrini]KER24099.1 hypothetical protein T265_08143 [Opisthorchis viverrini]
MSPKKGETGRGLWKNLSCDFEPGDTTNERLSWVPGSSSPPPPQKAIDPHPPCYHGQSTSELTKSLSKRLSQLESEDLMIFLCEEYIKDWRISVTKRRVLQVTLELLICSIHPLPGVNLFFELPSRPPQNITILHPIRKEVGNSNLMGKFSPYLLLVLPMIGRLYLAFRTLLLHSKMFNDAGSRSIGSMNKVGLSVIEILRCPQGRSEMIQVAWATWPYPSPRASFGWHGSQAPKLTRSDIFTMVSAANPHQCLVPEKKDSQKGTQPLYSEQASQLRSTLCTKNHDDLVPPQVPSGFHLRHLDHSQLDVAGMRTGAGWTKWLERKFTDREVRGSNPTSASRLPLSSHGRPGSIPALVLHSCGMAARHRKDASFPSFFNRIQMETQLSPLNSAWLISVTFLSIGYGDIVPHTHCGRLVAVITGLMQMLQSDSTNCVIDLIFQETRSRVTRKHTTRMPQQYCSILSVPNCHATRRKHEGWDTARLSKPRQRRRDAEGSACTALLVAVFSRKLELSKAEKHVLHFMEANEITKRVKHCAANVLRETWLLYKNARLMPTVNPKRVRVHQRRFLQAIYSLRKIKVKQREMQDKSDSLVDLAKLQTNVFEGVADISLRQDSFQSQLKCIEHQLLEIKRLIVEERRIEKPCSSQHNLVTGSRQPRRLSADNQLRTIFHDSS